MFQKNIMEKDKHRGTNKQAGKQTDGHTDRQKHKKRKTGRQRHRPKQIETDRERKPTTLTEKKEEKRTGDKIKNSSVGRK